MYPFFNFEEVRTISKQETLINEEIRDKEVRVIDADGTMLGVLAIEDALKVAEERDLDLVNVSPNANPPVCKILDYGKYRYELQKRAKEAKKKQSTTEIKEIRLSVFIEENDINTKAKNAAKFLANGDKVKVSLRFRGRERDYTSKGMDVLNSFAEKMQDIAVIEKKPKLEGRQATMVVAPKAEK